MKWKQLGKIILGLLLIIILLNIAFNFTTGNHLDIDIIHVEVVEYFDADNSNFTYVNVDIKVQVTNPGGFKFGRDPLCYPALDVLVISSDYIGDDPIGYNPIICDGGGFAPKVIPPFFNQTLSIEFGNFILPLGKTSFSFEYLGYQDSDTVLTMEVFENQQNISISYQNN